MKTLLRVDASIRLIESNTRVLTDYFEEAWLRANPDGKVIRRCLTTDVIPHLSQEAFEAFSVSGEFQGSCRLKLIIMPPCFL